MKLAFKSGGTVLAQVDLDTLSAAIPTVEAYPCPACQLPPLLAKDGGGWYIMGQTPGCKVCGRLWSLPSDDEAADLRT